MTYWWKKLLMFPVVFTLLTLQACSGSGDGDLPAGSEGGPCYGNGTCDPGLTCNSSNICVQENVDLCEDETCSDHGMCAVADGNAICICDDGYHDEDLACVEDSTDPCEGVTCSGHGTCAVASGNAICVCDEGYHDEELACVENDPDDPCEGVTCSGHGICAESSGNAICICDDGYHTDGLACVEDTTDPCEGVTCSGHGTCAVASGNAICVCDEGYHDEELTCVEDTSDPCEGFVGFDSSFATDASGWTEVVGDWEVSGGYYTTSLASGAPDASVSYDTTFSDFTFEVRVRTTGHESLRHYGLWLRGDPTPIGTSDNWQAGYEFDIHHNGEFAIIEASPDGSRDALVGWSSSAAIDNHGWNTLRVEASGENLTFFVNDEEVATVSDSSYESGHVGIMTSSNNGGGTVTIQVDYARLTCIES